MRFYFFSVYWTIEILFFFFLSDELLCLWFGEKLGTDAERENDFKEVIAIEFKEVLYIGN